VAFWTFFRIIVQGGDPQYDVKLTKPLGEDVRTAIPTEATKFSRR
jgi:hypothetical protein